MIKTENSLSENHPVLNIRSLIWPMTAAILIVFWISFMAVSEKHIITENKDNQYTYIEDGRYVLLVDNDKAVTALPNSEDLSTAAISGNTEAQTFYFTRQKNGYYTIVSTYTWGYWSLNKEGYLVTTDTFTGEAGQFWAVQYLEKDHYRIFARNGQMVRLKGSVLSTNEKEYACFVFREAEE